MVTSDTELKGGLSELNKHFVQFAKTLKLSAENNYHGNLFQQNVLYNEILIFF